MLTAFFYMTILENQIEMDQEIILNNLIVKELNFNADQMQEFKEIGKDHRERMMKLDQEDKKLKDQLFSKISEKNVIQLEIERITSLIGENRKK